MTVRQEGEILLMIIIKEDNVGNARPKNSPKVFIQTLEYFRRLVVKIRQRI
jgi:hypothetical protein